MLVGALFSLPTIRQGRGRRTRRRARIRTRTKANNQIDTSATTTSNIITPLKPTSPLFFLCVFCAIVLVPQPPIPPSIHPSITNKAYLLGVFCFQGIRRDQRIVDVSEFVCGGVRFFVLSSFVLCCCVGWFFFFFFFFVFFFFFFGFFFGEVARGEQTTKQTNVGFFLFFLGLRS